VTSVRVDFVDFWPGFDRKNNVLLDVLRTRFAVEVVDDPDFLFFANFGRCHRRYRCIRIFYTGENVRPDFRRCDWALTFDHLPGEPRHLRWPLYNLYLDDPSFLLARRRDVDAVVAEKTRFCNIVCSNPRAKERLRFLEQLSRYKRVQSGGRVRNNVGGPVRDKLAFIRHHRFTIAFENASYPGYTTEKIVEPMRVDSIPIYWGNPLVHLDFNTASFVSWHACGSDEATIERIIEIDRDEALYRQMLLQPWLPGGRLTAYSDRDVLLDWLERVFAARRASRPDGPCWSRLRRFW
jgi:hypothetical protein